MSGNGGDNAHNNAFGGGKNPGIGNSGSGNHSGSSGSNGHSGGGHFTGPSMTVDANGEVHVNLSGYEKDKNKPGGNSGGHSGNGKGDENLVNGATITPDPGKPGSYISSEPGRTMLASSIDDNSANGNNVYTLHTGKNQTIKVTVPNGNIEQMNVEYNNWKGPKLKYKDMKKFISGFMAYRKAEDQHNEKEALLKASELISDMGEKVGKYLDDKYKAVAREIADNIKNFQGKTLRTYEQTMASLNKILANPGMKINQGDRDTLINAWKNLNAGDMANKLGNLSRAFKVADIAMKVEKVKEKSVLGYETGDWGPLMLEVESWVLSGVMAGVATAILGSVVSTFLVAGSLPAAIVTIGGLMAIAYLASLIDANIAEKFNNEVIRPAH
ncbi:TPA: colicin-N [Escherichia coli]|nr:colicin-N [Escherichia coli]HAX5126171.1 colicin-N [Escherichia coli]HAX5177081.1 colicin-N [Escherichia coli]HAX5298379.1 colicin-N [Escherichia coli]